MKKYNTITLFFLTFIFFKASYADIEKGRWNFIEDPDYCYIGSIPEKTDLPDGKQRGSTYILVYRINKSQNPIIQIEAGYPYKSDQNIIVEIDNSKFIFFADDETAWTNNDDKVIYAMKKGNLLTIKGQSSRDTKTIDQYTLKGFTAAYNKLINDC
tara:strand:- start:236 stop:703 length:468 start_codon:yes stop_codon:yes gene_type:complete